MILSPEKEKELDRLLQIGKLEEAKNLLESYLNSELSMEEKASAYMAFVNAYMRMVLRINTLYEEKLTDILENLELLEKEELSVSDRLSLALLNKDIDNLPNT